jgi:hypothetical protein
VESLDIYVRTEYVVLSIDVFAPFLPWSQEVVDLLRLEATTNPRHEGSIGRKRPTGRVAFVLLSEPALGGIRAQRPSLGVVQPPVDPLIIARLLRWPANRLVFFIDLHENAASDDPPRCWRRRPGRALAVGHVPDVLVASPIAAALLFVRSCL